MSSAHAHKLSSAFEGALAGGGDPATSPLYVFTPFLKLIVLGAVAGVAEATFGASVWLVVLTVFVVSVMYRRVMQWVTDGSGGSGLSEEEFGGWAVKTNGAITYIEYTLTFLVSLAAMVTFLADRFPALNNDLPGISARAWVAVALSILTGWLVNRGPKTAARFFGPATFGVLVLLWAMIGATAWYHFQAWTQGTGPLVGAPLLPTVDLRAFSLAPTAPGEPSYLNFTLGGYARILALMTGIEVFANLVAAYGGNPEDQARKAFGSLVIIMGSTAMTMLVVGPAIFALSDPANTEVSVFTQTMDALLPAPVAYAGTLVGVAVLLSAAAASAEGIQNLSLGLATRRYIPPMFGRANRFGVAALPVWLEVAVCCLAFIVIGTSEETYLAIYAAGVFILLSMTGWAASKRLLRISRGTDGRLHLGNAAALSGSVLAALLTTAATLVIFGERFFEGAWVFFLFIPAFYVAFTYVRRRAGLPSGPRPRPAPRPMPGPAIPTAARTADEMRQIIVEPGQPLPPPPPAPHPIGLGGVRVDLRSHVWPTLPQAGSGWRAERARLDHVVAALDGTAFAALALPLAARLAGPGRLTLLSAIDEKSAADADARRSYLEAVATEWRRDGRDVDVLLRQGEEAARAIAAAAEDLDANAIVLTSRGGPNIGLPVLGSVATQVVRIATLPVVVVRPRPDEEEPGGALSRVLVALDGSTFAERVLPYATTLARRGGTEIVVLTVPEIAEAEGFGPQRELVRQLHEQSEAQAVHYVRSIVSALVDDGLEARGLVGGLGPARAIAEESAREDVSLVMLATHGRGTFGGLILGSVAGRVVRQSAGAVFLLPIRERRGPATESDTWTSGGD